tara:strand:- start:79 stop:510 length:432 start_codon:yes stop_codon:yes gene_type:complete
MIHNIYATKINPSDYNTKPLKKRLSKQGKPDKDDGLWIYGINFMNLYRDIKKNGIKYPILMESVKGKSFVTIGMQRVAIADELKLDLVDAVVYSTNGKVNLNGVPIKELNDIVKIYGKSIIGEPVFSGIISAIIKTHKKNQVQ